MLSLVVRTQVALVAVADAMHERMRNERGAISAEYIGLIAVLVAVMAALAAFAQPIATAIKDMIIKNIKGV